MLTLEARLYQSRFASGLLDLCAGIALAAIALSFTWDQGAFIGLGPALGLALFLPVQKLVVQPRIGDASLTEKREAQVTRDMRRLLFGGVVMLGLNLALFASLATLPERELQQWIGGLPAALIAVMVASAGWVTLQNRFYLYAIVLLAGGMVTGSHGADPGGDLLAGATAMLAAGGYHFFRFLRDPAASLSDAS